MSDIYERLAKEHFHNEELVNQNRQKQFNQILSMIVPGDIPNKLCDQLLAAAEKTYPQSLDICIKHLKQSFTKDEATALYEFYNQHPQLTGKLQQYSMAFLQEQSQMLNPIITKVINEFDE